MVPSLCDSRETSCSAGAWPLSSELADEKVLWGKCRGLRKAGLLYRIEELRKDLLGMYFAEVGRSTWATLRMNNRRVFVGQWQSIAGHRLSMVVDVVSVQEK